MKMMKNPVHPGRIVRTACLESLGLTVKDAAEVLGISRQTLNNVVNEKAGISPEMAIRLEKAFGGTAQAWLQMQTNYDLARAVRSQDKIKVTRYHPPHNQTSTQR
jgi:antitoxin HigA-1